MIMCYISNRILIQVWTRRAKKTHPLIVTQVLLISLRRLLKPRDEGKNRRKIFSVTKVLQRVMRAEAVEGTISKTLCHPKYYTKPKVTAGS